MLMYQHLLDVFHASGMEAASRNGGVPAPGSTMRTELRLYTAIPSLGTFRITSNNPGWTGVLRSEASTIVHLGRQRSRYSTRDLHKRQAHIDFLFLLLTMKDER